jgi:3-hydroxyisobutyrate dehydrogenase-like beta-hydroxyacid dehydrogenase
MKVAILGTGLMGAAMAKRLARHGGFDVVLWNRNRARAEAVGVGMVAHSAREAVTGAEAVISALLDARVLREVYLGPSGAASAATGQVFIETSTAGPSVLEDLAAALRAHGSGIVDAPLLGSTDAVEAGRLLILVGGAAADFQAARPVLEPLGTVEHVGELGSAAKLKLIHNSFLATITAAAAEVLTAGSAAGLPRDRVFSIVTRLSPYLKRRERALLDRTYEPVTFALKTMIKDLDLALDFYHQNGVAAQLTAMTRELYAEAAVEHGELDVAAIVKRYEQLSRGPRD